MNCGSGYIVVGGYGVVVLAGTPRKSPSCPNSSYRRTAVERDGADKVFYLLAIIWEKGSRWHREYGEGMWMCHSWTAIYIPYIHHRHADEDAAKQGITFGRNTTISHIRGEVVAPGTP